MGIWTQTHTLLGCAKLAVDSVIRRIVVTDKTNDRMNKTQYRLKQCIKGINNSECLLIVDCLI